MATPETSSAYARLVHRAGGSLPPPSWSEPGDLARMSTEAMTEQRGDVREHPSHGVVRLSGAGVSGHSAALDEVGSIALHWQRCVTAVGAALEGTKTSFGQIPRSVVQRTQLVLNAAPSPGSVVLDVSPTADPTIEAYPGGQVTFFDAPRPLADRAAETLIGLLGHAATVGPDADEFGLEILRLGPRVASHLKRLADVLDKAHFDLDVSWAEPSRPTRRAALSAGAAGWLRDFVQGRALDGQEAEMSGIVRTVSDIAKWSIETPEGLRSVDARALDTEVIQDTRVGQYVRLVALVRVTERPDGSTSTTYDALEILSRN
jgi:hypothetical protein